MRIEVIGPSVERTKGGMATVIKNMLEDKVLNTRHQLVHEVSHVEGNVFEKITYIYKTFFKLLIKMGCIDVMHFHIASDASFYRKSIFILLGKLFRKPMIAHVHGADFDRFFNQSGSVQKAYIKKLFTFCEKIIVLSDSWKNYFERNIINKNVEVLNNAVNIDEYTQCINNGEKEYKTFLFFGRLGERKGVFDLIEVINDIINLGKVPNLKFILAGDGEVEKVHQLIEKFHLKDYVEITGWVDKEKRLEVLRRADTVVLPSYDEGLPMALIEGMAAGKVIISTRVGGIPDMIEDGINGFLHVPGDRNALKELILKVIEENHVMNQISQNNIKKAMDSYNINKISKRLLEIYNEVKNKKQGEIKNVN